MKVWVRGSDDEVDWRARARETAWGSAAARDSNSCQVKTSLL